MLLLTKLFTVLILITTQALAGDKNYEDGSFEYFDNLFSTSQFEKGLSEIDGYIKNHPKKAEGYFLKGSYALAIQKYDIAVANLEKTLEIKNNPTGVGIHAGLIMAYHKVKEHQKTIETMNTAIGIDKKIYSHYDAVIATGYSYMNLGRLNEAKEFFRNAVNSSPEIAKNKKVMGAIRKLHQAMNDKS